MDAQNLTELRKAGKIAAKALEHGRKLIKPGASLLEVTKQIEDFIHAEGGEPAFPVNLSLNDCAAHYTAKKDDSTVFKDEIIKLDVGVHVNGFIGDTACTIDLSGKNAKLREASEKAVEAAIKLVKPGVTLGEIGKAIEKTITDAGFKPIRNLSGHGLEQYHTHAYPTIPNYDSGDGEELEEDMIIAIEPFATTGVGMIKESGNAEIFNMREFKAVRVGFVREIIKYIEKKFKTLPFSRRGLLSKFSEPQVNYALKQFAELEILNDYAPLVERAGGLVSQAEHTLLVTKDGCEVLTRI